MFQRDKDLRARGGADRSRVLEEAKEQREARAQQREKDAAAQRLQRFARGRLAVRLARAARRLDFDSKVTDIDRLRVLLQRETLPLPFNVILGLLKMQLFFHCGSRADQTRLAKLCSLFRDALDGQPVEPLAALSSSHEWSLLRLVDLCIQTHSAHDGSSFVLAQRLVDLFGFVRDHIATTNLRAFSPRVPQYSQMERVGVMELVRRSLLSRSSPPARPDRPGENHTDLTQLVRFAIEAATSSRGLEVSFVESVLSVPLLPDVVSADALDRLSAGALWPRIVDSATPSALKLPPSPTEGIASIVWLLGNLLWLLNRASSAQLSDEAVACEVNMLTKYLQAIPVETFAPSGGAVSWTKVSDSHSIPVVYPDGLSNQLRLLMTERRIRQYCERLIYFNPSALRRPLVKDRPTPMYPGAPTIHEQYGFGDIASSGSLQQSLSETWQRMKSMGKASWAKRLLEKTGLKKNADASERKRKSLLNTSTHARQLAQGAGDIRAPLRGQLGDEAFKLSSVYALVRFFATFLYRWPHHTKPSQGCQASSMNVINVLSFFKLSTVSQTSEDDSTHFVTFLWTVLQEVKNFESFSRDVNLLHVNADDGYVATLILFCATYGHLLMVLDEEEMYGQEFPIPLYQLERVVIGLKHSLHSAYWIHGMRPAHHGTSLECGMFLVDVATRLLNDLKALLLTLSRCDGRILPGLDSSQLINEVLAGTPRANKLISSMPYIVPFPERVKLFQRLVEADKLTHQGDPATGSAVAAYRVRIRRGAILEDGLTKLNVIRNNLKKKINVVFVNAAGREEVGIDAGGLFKEFWLDLSNLAFDLQYGLFLTTPNDQLLYPNPQAASPHFTRESDHLTLFQFVGRILGKALYEGIVVQPKFAQFFLAKLLHSFNNLSDLPSLDPVIYKNLMFLKSYDGDVEDLGLTFTVVKEFFGEQRELELLPDGANIAVTNTNRTRYVHLVANFYLNTQIRDQSAAFRAGLADLIDVRWLQLFNEPELQVLISGKSGDIDVGDLKVHTKYAGGYYAMDKRVQWFWQALESFSPSERSAFLRFATSCQRAPSLGFGTLTPPFCIQKISIRRDEELLPSSSTCFNTLKLPTYSSSRVLRAKLLLSISSGAGFEMT